MKKNKKVLSMVILSVIIIFAAYKGWQKYSAIDPVVAIPSMAGGECVVHIANASVSLEKITQLIPALAPLKSLVPVMGETALKLTNMPENPFMLAFVPAAGMEAQADKLALSGDLSIKKLQARPTPLFAVASEKDLQLMSEVMDGKSDRFNIERKTGQGGDYIYALYEQGGENTKNIFWEIAWGGEDTGAPLENLAFLSFHTNYFENIFPSLNASQGETIKLFKPAKQKFYGQGKLEGLIGLNGPIANDLLSNPFIASFFKRIAMNMPNIENNMLEKALKDGRITLYKADKLYLCLEEKEQKLFLDAQGAKSGAAEAQIPDYMAKLPAPVNYIDVIADAGVLKLLAFFANMKNMGEIKYEMTDALAALVPKDIKAVQFRLISPSRGDLVFIK